MRNSLIEILAFAKTISNNFYNQEMIETAGIRYSCIIYIF